MEHSVVESTEKKNNTYIVIMNMYIGVSIIQYPAREHYSV